MPTNALQTAAYRGSTAMVSLLLDHGADIDAQREGRSLALETAAELGHLDILKLLMQCGADINMCKAGEEKRTALYRAASERQWEAFDLLLERSANVDRSGHSAYDYILRKLITSEALRNSHQTFSRIKRLLELGADPNARDEDSQTAIYLICGQNIPIVYFDKAVQVVQLLIDHGADVNMVGGRYGTALQACALFGHLSVAKLLLKNGAIVGTQAGGFGYALQAACWREDNLAMVRLLLDRGADINIYGGEYGTALQAACAKQWPNIEVIRLLLDRGADINTCGGKYGTALQAACARDDPTIEVIRLLLDRGADINILGGKYRTALQAACAEKSRMSHISEVVSLLLDRGADSNISGEKYGTALQAACASCKPDIWVILMLLEHGANVLEPGGEYGSAWNAAVIEREQSPKLDDDPYITLLHHLLKHGANVNHVINEVGSALHHVLSQKMFFDPFLDKDLYKHVENFLGLERRWIGRIFFLLANGADVNLNRGAYGFPLQVVCAIEYQRNCHWVAETYRLWFNVVPKVVEMLLQHDHPRVDINACGGMFGTALQAAAYSGQTKSVHLLLKGGSHVACSERCGKYRSALNAAVVKGHWDIVDILLKAGAKSDCHLQPEIDEE